MRHALTLTCVLLLTALTVAGCAAPGSPDGVSSGQREAESRPVAVTITPEQRVKAGEVLRDAGQFDAALKEFNRALEVNPRSVDAVLGIGTVQHKQEEYAAARDTFNKAVTMDGLRYDSRYYLGLMQQVLGETGQAIANYTRALELNPDDPRSHRELATAYLQVGRPDLALNHAQVAVRLDNGSQQAWCNLAATYAILGRLTDALDAYRTAAGLGTLDAPVLLGLGDTHLRLGNVQRAINTLEELVRLYPGPVSHERLAYALFRAQDFRGAEMHYRASLSFDPDQPATLNGLGACHVTAYMQQKDLRDKARLREAITAWRQSLTLNPDQPQIVDLITRYNTIR